VRRACRFKGFSARSCSHKLLKDLWTSVRLSS